MLGSRWFPATGRSSNHCWKNCSPTRSVTSARFVSYCVPTRVSSRKNSGPSCGTRKPRLVRRFRAAVALADYVPESEAASWSEQDLKFVAEQLVSSNAEFQPLLRDALRPIRARLLGGSGADLRRCQGDRSFSG